MALRSCRSFYVAGAYVWEQGNGRRRDSENVKGHKPDPGVSKKKKFTVILMEKTWEEKETGG